jgi:hypothetical protein
MAGMVVAVRPTVVVQGTVQSVQTRAKKDSGEVYKHDVTVLTSSGGQTTVEFWERQGQPSPALPDVLERVALVVEISPPNGNFGASFGFSRYVTDNDLDLIVSSAPALAGK